MIQWQKPSFSGGAAGNECVELAQRQGALLTCIRADRTS
ncbi:DUF397 domain-containing protein [Streptomyces mirabilis]